ncbi:hypothetical protein DICPUDRAFT_82361 [Dictyostelium purpureum]|uniref:MRH domain-containing protein n=1 Tax=Dictyostelium purpureum TaxID=5786 RepID=F0ZWA8_DICPU|nr:uncharacterized protein DICPUDRAFT_82361 [Dictyostelium purpureum]EGC31776.1 hypothetical protein DICPUDRAFT_82361 [Dictyostelium purpureum]|eukprot:XP_003291699.1 hypothetical protein DICPUDRAFT_82361 [Dictyostelium purpureum]
MNKINFFILSFLIIYFLQPSKSENIPLDCKFKSNFYNAEFDLSSLKLDSGYGYQINSGVDTYNFNLCGYTEKCYSNYSRQSCKTLPSFQVLGDLERGSYTTDGIVISLNYVSDSYSNTSSPSCLYESTYEISCIRNSTFNIFISNISIDHCHYKFKLLSHFACIDGVYYPTEQETTVKEGDSIPIYAFSSQDFNGAPITFKMVSFNGETVYERSNIKYSSYIKGVYTYNLVIPKGNYYNGSISTSIDGFTKRFAYINPYSGNDNSTSTTIDYSVVSVSSSLDLDTGYNNTSTNYNSNNSEINSSDEDEGWSNWKIAFVVVSGVLGATLIFGTILFVHQRNRVERTIRDINIALKNSQTQPPSPSPSPKNHPTHHPESNPNYYSDNFENYGSRPTQEQQNRAPRSPPPAYSTIVPESNEKISISFTSSQTIYEEASSSSNNYNNNNNNDDESDDESEVKSKMQTQKVGEGCKTQ